MVKPNVKKREKGVHFVVRCHVFAKIRKNNMLFMCTLTRVLETLFMPNLVILPVLEFVVKHVAATLFQLLDYIELGLFDIPDDKICTQEIQKWHVPKNIHYTRGSAV